VERAFEQQLLVAEDQVDGLQVLDALYCHVSLP
jgi:hypothetical protein